MLAYDFKAPRARKKPHFHLLEDLPPAPGLAAELDRQPASEGTGGGDASDPADPCDGGHPLRRQLANALQRTPWWRRLLERAGL